MTQGDDKVSEMNARLGALNPGQCAALIYTSGTTGDPKAVMISHDNIVYIANATVQMMKTDSGFAQSDEERILSYLPLSHIAGMMIDIVAPLVTAAWNPTKTAIFFARIYDLVVFALV